MKQFDFSKLKRDNTMKYLHDLYREGSRSGERFAITSTSNPRKGMLLRSRSVREIRNAKAYLEQVWGKGCEP